MSHGVVSPSFGRFQVIQLVRHDGATTHYDAVDFESGHPVALITAPAGPDTAEENRLAFRLPRMRHPNIVSVLDAGLEGDVAFVAAECLQTEPLSVFVARAGRMPFFQGLPLVLQLLSAIEHAQARRMVHATIDVEHVQVTPGGQPKLPAAGWSLSTERQPNLQAAARIARAVLSGSCPPALRGALEQVLLRAEAPDPEARYQRADEFILALLGAAGYLVASSAAADRRVPAEPQWIDPVPSSPASVEPGWTEPVPSSPAGAEPQWIDPVPSPGAAAEPQWIDPAPSSHVPAEPELASPVPSSHPAAIHAVRREPRRPVRRHRAGRNVLAACLAAALLVPALVGERVFTGIKDAPKSAQTVALGAPPARVAPVALEQAAVAPAPVAPAPVVPAPVVPAAVAPAAVAPAPIALASVEPSPVQASTVQPLPERASSERASPVQPLPERASPVQPLPERASPVQTSSDRPSPAAAAVPAARSTAHPVAVAPRSIPPKPAARTAFKQQVPHAPPAAPARQAHVTKLATTHAHAARPPQRARTLTASGCPYDELPVFRQLCEARQCSRPELRNTPSCARMLAEQRAALARLRGTPD
jgi:hypothetical protein